MKADENWGFHVRIIASFSLHNQLVSECSLYHGSAIEAKNVLVEM